MRRNLLVAFCAVVAVLGVAGCTETAPSQNVMLRDPTGLLQQSLTAAEHASGVHVKYMVQTIPDTIRIDAHTNADGTASGDYVQGDNDIPMLVGKTISYVRLTGGAVVLLGVPITMTTAQAIGKWLPSGSPVLRPTTASTRLQGIQFASLVTAMLETHRKDPLTVAGATKVGGVAAHKYQTSNGTTITIADAAPHYPLEIAEDDGRRDWQFLDWNKATTITLPPADQIDHDPAITSPPAI